MGFAVLVNPLADFYTKYYIEVISILWATSFSLLILFLPKLQAFYRFKMKQRKEELEKMQQEKSSNSITQQQQQQQRKSIFSFLKASNLSNTNYYDNYHAESHHHHQTGGISELLSLEQILASDDPVLDDDDNSLRRRKPSAISATTTTDNGGSSNFIEVHEGEMPIRKVFRYFPFLSQWEMHHIMVFPWLGYFSHFSVSLYIYIYMMIILMPRFKNRNMQRKVPSCHIIRHPYILLNWKIMYSKFMAKDGLICIFNYLI